MNVRRGQKQTKVRDNSACLGAHFIYMSKGSDSDSVVLFPQAKGDFGLRMNYALKSIGILISVARFSKHDSAS